MNRSKSLFIFSDTPFYKTADGIYVFEPTLREIEEIADLFNEILWMSYVRGSVPEKNCRQVKVNNIQLLCLPDLRGGTIWYAKIKVLLTLPFQFIYLLWVCRGFHIIHTRGPSIPALLILLSSFFNRKKKYWYKYAGDWDAANLPLSFRIQRALILKQRQSNFYVTVNGNRKNVHSRFLTFENPCLSNAELESASSTVKDFSGLWNICFVGNLAPFKGAVRLVQALTDPAIAARIKTVWIVGDGEEKKALKNFVQCVSFSLQLPGYMSRQDIFEKVYAQSHFLILPSESEGFPKVVAEAAAHRCIPVVTDVSVISQYVKHGANGFLLKDGSAEKIVELFKNEILQKSEDELKIMADNAALIASEFTYEKFRSKVRSTFLDN